MIGQTFILIGSPKLVFRLVASVNELVVRRLSR